MDQFNYDEQINSISSNRH